MPYLVRESKEMKTTATVTSKGQITIPASVRRALGVQTGDSLEFALHAGKVEVRAARPKRSSAGILKPYLPKGWRPPTVEEMNEGIRRHVAKKFLKR